MKRRNDETFEDYKKRRANANFAEKVRRLGRVFWPTHRIGTYVKSKEGK